LEEGGSEESGRQTYRKASVRPDSQKNPFVYWREGGKFLLSPNICSEVSAFLAFDRYDYRQIRAVRKGQRLLDHPEFAGVVVERNRGDGDSG
jgi:hypothetical protein